MSFPLVRKKNPAGEAGSSWLGVNEYILKTTRRERQLAPPLPPNHSADLA